MGLYGLEDLGEANIEEHNQQCLVCLIFAIGIFTIVDELCITGLSESQDSIVKTAGQLYVSRLHNLLGRNIS